MDEYTDARIERGGCLLKSIRETFAFDSLGSVPETTGIDPEKVCTYRRTGREQTDKGALIMDLSNSHSASCAAAGVDVTAGCKAVRRIKPMVESTCIPSVMGTLSGTDGAKPM